MTDIARRGYFREKKLHSSTALVSKGRTYVFSEGIHVVLQHDKRGLINIVWEDRDLCVTDITWTLPLAPSFAR